jgi:hypothetical protein
MRVAPLVIPLVFFLQLVRRVRELAARATDQPWWRRRATALAAFGVVLAVTATSPMVAAPRMIERNVKAWIGPDDEADAFAWIAGHTAARTRCVVPVDRQDAYERSRRPLVATWQAIR